jgi:hypothetical protein
MSMSFRRLRRNDVETERKARARPADEAEAGRSGANVNFTRTAAAPAAYEPLFGAAADAPSAYARASARDPRDQLLLSWIRVYLGPRAEAAAVRIKNKTPSKAGCHYLYTIQHGYEAQDLMEIDNAMSSGRLYRSGMLLLGGAWSRLLLGPRFALGASKKQIHELNYKRSVCICLPCQIVRMHLAQAATPLDATNASTAATIETSTTNTTGSFVSAVYSSSSVTENDMAEVRPVEYDADPSSDSRIRYSADRAHSLPTIDAKRSSAATAVDTNETALLGGGSMSMKFLTSVAPKHFSDCTLPRDRASEIAEQRDFVDRVPLPSATHMKMYLGAEVQPGEICIGELVGLHRPKSTRLVLSNDVKFLFAENAYCGPAPADRFTANLITNATEYYKLKKGKRSRKVFLRGSVARLPLEVGAIKSPTTPTISHELGAAFVLFARQT